MRAILPALLLAASCVPAAKTAGQPILDATVMADDQSVSVLDFMQRTERHNVVCVGEQHDNAKHHRLQHQILAGLIERSAERGIHLALGMEMFRRHMQPALNAYYRGSIDGEQLRRATDWDRSWGFDFAMYEPMLRLAREHRVRIIGLNASRALTRAVARRGLEGLPEPVRLSLPLLVLDDAGHRKFFWAIMGFSNETSAPQNGHGAMSPERFYAAQVIWDETMAEGASSWLADPQPRQLMLVAGNGHCHRSAVPRRIERRSREPNSVLSVLVVSPGGEPLEHVQSDFVIEVR